MANIFKKAAGIFLEFEESNPGDSASSATVATGLAATSSHGSLPTQSVDVKENFEKFQNHFSKLLDDNNLPGPDYYEFLKVMESLKTHIPDEKSRFTVGFTSLSVSGMTKEKLLESTRYYLDMLQQDRDKFLKTLSIKEEDEVQGRSKKGLQLKKRIEDNSLAIQKLTREIAEAQAEITLLNEELRAAEEKLKLNQHA